MSQKVSNNLLDYVNPLQGTDSTFEFSNGNTLPLISLPFASTSWSPQTESRNDYAANFYFSPRAKKLQGMRATRQPSPWIGDYGHFTIMPQAGVLFPGARERASVYRLENSIIKPHYFKTWLERYRTTFELTPTTKCSYMRITFSENNEARLLFQFFDGETSINTDPQQSVIRGYTRANSGGTPGNFACYFIAKLNCSMTHDCGSYKKNSIGQGQNFESSAGGTYWVGIKPPENGIVNLRIATSFISIDQAARNLENEIGNRSFNQALKEASDLWNKVLSRIEIDSVNEKQAKTFYSAMYRAVLFPRTWHESDAHGNLIHFSPYDGKIHDGEMVADNGPWDTHRTVYPYLSLLFPERLSEILRGWINAYKEGGWFPKWSSPGYRACMIGTHMDAVMADAAVKGIADFDLQVAYEGMRKNTAKTGDPAGKYGRVGLKDFIQLGFVPADKIEHSASRTMDFAYNDFCVAQVAKILGYDDDYILFQKRAMHYRNNFDKDVGFMRGRNSDGSWQEPFDEFAWGGAFIEGSVWQCGWAVPYDVAGLIKLMGGKKKFTGKLDKMMQQPPQFNLGTYPLEIHEMTEMASVDFGQYAHSNQPAHHVLYLYASAGAPWKTQYWVRRVLSELYNPDSDGFAGDEDNGEMSCWYLFSALGFYPLCPGHPSYVFGSPLFKQA